MKTQFNKQVRDTPNWKVGDHVWLNGRNISTTRPSPKLDYRWLGPFPIKQKISNSAYKLTLPLSMKNVHPVFHVSILRKHNQDLIQQRRHAQPPAIIIDNEEEWEVEQILDCRRRYNKKEYLVAWKGFGKEQNSWELELNLKHCKELVKDFNSRFPEASDRYKRRRRKK